MCHVDSKCNVLFTTYELISNANKHTTKTRQDKCVLKLWHPTTTNTIYTGPLFTAEWIGRKYCNQKVLLKMLNNKVMFDNVENQFCLVASQTNISLCTWPLQMYLLLSTDILINIS